jgi:5-formyltetrahydrofolate cyclo-ligase
MHVSDQKSQLRQSIEQRLKQLSDKDREAESRSICRRLLEHIPEGSTVCAYSALKTEANLSLLIETLYSRDDAMYLPVFLPRLGETGELNFRKFDGWNTIEKGKLGIAEPSHTAEVLNPQDVDLVLLPGRAFDRNGNRMGRGNGGYDVWIEKQRKLNPATQYWGVCLDCQLVQEVPVEKHDQKMDRVVTGREFLEM